MAKKRRGERADGLIQISISLGYNADGKRIRRVFYGKTRAEAERKKAEFLAARESSSKYNPDPKVNRNIK